MSLGGMCYLSSVSEVSILGLLTLTPLLLGWRYFSRLYFSLSFSLWGDILSLLIIGCSPFLPFPGPFLPGMWIWDWYSSSCKCGNLLWHFIFSGEGCQCQGGGYLIFPMMSVIFVMVFSFIFLSLSILCIRRVRRRRRSWAALTILEDCTLLIWRRRMLELDFYLALIRSLLISP